MKEEISFNWQDGLKIVLAVLTFGIGWFADNQSTVVAYVTMTLVWLVSEAVKYLPKYPWLGWMFKGKGPLTVMIFLVSFGLSYLFHPFALPLFPAWTGDAGSFVPLFSTWISSVLSIIGGAVVFAMSVYNLLAASVLEKVPNAITRMFHQ